MIYGSQETGAVPSLDLLTLLFGKSTHGLRHKTS